MRKIIIIGTPRNGSKYITQCLLELGIDAYHHNWGRQAKVSWDAVQELDDKFILHLIRNPYHAIPLIMMDNQSKSAEYQFRRDTIMQIFGVDLEQYGNEERAVLTFLFWNKIISNKNVATIKVEQVQDVLRVHLHNAGYLTNNIVLLPYSKILVRTPFQWDLVRSEIMSTLNKWCLDYKYATIIEQISLENEMLRKPQEEPETDFSPLKHPHVMGPRRRETGVLTQTFMGAANAGPKPSVMDPSGEMVIRPRLKHRVVVPVQTSQLMSMREAAKINKVSIRKK